MIYPNWFSASAEKFFDRHLTPLAGKPDLWFLQIGAFTGDASLWMLDNVLTGDRSVLIDVDTWAGSDEAIHTTFDFADVERTYDRRVRTEAHAGRVLKVKGSSSAFLQSEFAPPDRYDFIYIDGDHTAYTVLNDAVDAYRCLKVGGLLAFDDYLWESGKGALYDPKPAINAVMAIYGGRLELVDMAEQAWFRRIA